jgi:hypothetical protein
MTRVADIRCAKVLFAFLIFIALPIKTFAWGYEGHRIIAEIAEQFLEPTTVKQSARPRSISVYECSRRPGPLRNSRRPLSCATAAGSS